MYRALGIGLGFQFDHMSKPSERKVSKTQRLQARAAKSAIRRVQEIYDPEAAKQELDRIQDPVKREQRAKELRAQSEIEVKNLATRLSELIPTDSSEVTPAMDFQKFEKISDNEFVVRNNAASPSDTVRRLMESLEVDENQNMENDEHVETKEDFLASWEKQRLGSVNTTDPDDDITTLLA